MTTELRRASDRLKLAKQVATQRHVFDKHMVHQGLPYTHHLQDVHHYVRWFAYISDVDAEAVEDLEVASWTHDLVEDTDTRLVEIEELFGPRVAALVGAVTNEPGVNRKARHALTYPKIRAEPLAVLLKLADRYANIAAGGGHVRMYLREHEDFKRALYTPGQWDEAWEELDALLALASKEQS